MSLKITCEQAYKIVYHFLDNIYFQTYNEFLSDILSGGALYSNISGKEPETMDPAIFGEWMDSIKMIMDDNTITYESQITIEQMCIATYQYFVIYCNKGAEPSIKKIRDLLGEDFNQSDVTRWLENKWLKSVEYVLQEAPTEKIGHLFGEATILTNRESFVVMQIFLDIFCKKNNNYDLIQLLKNSRLKQRDNYWMNVPDIIEPKIWDIWQNAVEVTLQQEKDQNLNLLNNYKAMPIFLMNYFADNQSDFVDKTIQKFEIDQSNTPKYFTYWCAWTNAAVKLNAQQTEILNNLISINTPISREVACKIIQAWLKYQKDLVGIDVVQQVLADRQGMQQAIDEIKQQQRSYLLLDNEVTILETYHVMIKLLELHGKVIPEFEVGQDGKPIDLAILLDWIRICEQVIKI